MLAVLVSATIFAVACEEEESSSVSSSNCYEEVQALADILVTRSNTFSNNPTTGNCNSLRSAAINMLSAAEDCDGGAAFAEQAQFWVDYDCSVFD